MEIIKIDIDDLLEKFYSDKLNRSIEDKNYITESGEDVSIKINEDGTLHISVLQFNGWIRTNIYHKDGVAEELYHKYEAKHTFY